MQVAIRWCSTLLFIISVSLIVLFYFLNETQTRAHFSHVRPSITFTKQQLILDRNQARLVRLYRKYNTLLNLTALQTNDSADKTMVYVCRERCGGWGDRLRGIVFVYVLALLTRRRFMIDMNYPCEIFKAVEPNLVNWTYVKYVKSKNRSRLVINTRNPRAKLAQNTLKNMIESENFVQAWSSYDDIWVTTNYNLVTSVFRNNYISNETRKLLGRLPLSEATMESLFALLFELLFKPSLAVRKRVDYILTASYHRQLICLHVRMGKNPTIPSDEPRSLSTNTTQTMLNFIDKNLFDKSSPFIFIASDSAKAVADVLQHYPNSSMTIVGPILHIDRFDKRSPTLCDGLIKAMADFYVLGECQISLLSKSGFSGWANYRREKPYEQLYIYNEASDSMRQASSINKSFIRHKSVTFNTIKNLI